MSERLRSEQIGHVVEPSIATERRIGSVPAEKSGIRTGDIIVAVDGVEVQSEEQLLQQAKGWKPKQIVALSLARDDQPRTVDVELMSVVELIGLRATGETGEQK